VEMSRNLKQLRALLCDPTRSALYAVAILTEMAFQETQDLVAACERTGVSVPALLLNLATPPSDCGLCTALRHREALIRRKFERAFPTRRLSLLHRQEEPRGLRRLQELGQSLFGHPHGAPLQGS
jgi:arsenite-transporting ATPase